MSTGPHENPPPPGDSIPLHLNERIARLMPAPRRATSAERGGHSRQHPDDRPTSSTTMPAGAVGELRLGLAAAVCLATLLDAVQARADDDRELNAEVLVLHTDILNPDALTSQVLTAALGRNHPVGTSPPGAGLNSPRARECAELQQAWRAAGDRLNAAWTGAAVILLELGTFPPPGSTEPIVLAGSSAIGLALAAAWAYEHPPHAWIQLTRLVHDELSLI